jgi:hypothetical protein
VETRQQRKEKAMRNILINSEEMNVVVKRSEAPEVIDLDNKVLVKRAKAVLHEQLHEVRKAALSPHDEDYWAALEERHILQSIYEM